MNNNFAFDLNLGINNPNVIEIINKIKANPRKNEMSLDSLSEIFKKKIYKKYPTMKDNPIFNQFIKNLFLQIKEGNKFELDLTDSNIFYQSQNSFICGDLLPRGEHEIYINNNSSYKKNINLIFDFNGRKINISFSTNTTIKKALQIFVNKFALEDEYVESFDFTVDAKRLDINSEEKIGDKFKNNCLITVIQVKGLIAA